jgi:sugar transferase (PEP-CTERM system associated)
MRLFQMHVRLPIVLLLMVESALFLFAPYLAVAILRPVPADMPALGLPVTAAAFSVVCVVALLAMGLYSTRQRSGLTGLVVRINVGLMVAVAAIAFAFYLVPGLALDRRSLALTGFVAMCSSVMARVLFEHIVDQNLFKARVLVFGAGRIAASLLALRRRTDQRGFKILAFVATPGDVVQAPDERLIDRPPDLFAWARANGIDEIVVAMDDRRRGFPVPELLECRMAGIEVLELPTFLERETGKVYLDAVNPSWIIFGGGFKASSFQQGLERAFDIVASLLLLGLASPLMLFTAAAIRIEDGLRAPVLYRQLRVGQFGVPFGVLKFRSMRTDAEQDGQARWAVSNDPRVTRVGAFIRKTRLDELPQLWNVLRGDMSFVGPRPERPEFVSQLEQSIPYYRERHAVKPGITGWAQLCYPYGSSERDALEKLQYDLYYVKNRGLIFDIVILLQTVEVVLWGKGAR